MVLQRQYGSADIDNPALDLAVLENAISIAKQCNPRTGSLTGVEVVRAALSHIGDMLLLQDDTTMAKVREIIGLDEFDASLTHIDDVYDMDYAITPIVDPDDLEYFPSSGGSLPSKCAFFFGSMQQDQPIFGDVMLDFDITLSTAGAVDAPDVPDTTIDADEDHGGPGTDNGWLTRVYEAEGATYAEFVANAQLQALVEDALAGGAAIMHGLAQIEADIQSSTLGDVFAPFTNPSSWVLDGVILWAHMSAYAAMNDAGDASDYLKYNNWMSHSDAAAQILNNSFISEFRDSMQDAFDAGITPSVLAPNGILGYIADHGSMVTETVGPGIGGGLFLFPKGTTATYNSEFLTAGHSAESLGVLTSIRSTFSSMSTISTTVWGW